MNNLCLKNDEKAIFSLRSLYSKYGYSQYTMSKFEEYDLYVKNKNFLVSDNIITFTDTDGRLMALKPDVTLSIVKNIKKQPHSVQKLYYNENVYRVSEGSKSFKEIMQTGLECIGSIDSYTVYEVIMLAAESLKSISPEYVLDISHLGIVSKLIDSLSVTEKVKKKILRCLSEKNLPELSDIAKEENINCDNIKKLITTYGTLDEIMPFLETLDCREETDEIIKIMSALEKGGYKNKVRIDFSIVSDMNYYNGFVFKGFINGIPGEVLTGGQYDNLMAKLRRNEKAIGFAVYLDMLGMLPEDDEKYDVDTLILYDDSTDISAIGDITAEISKNCGSVMLQRDIPDKLRYARLVKIEKGSVNIIENNA